MKSISYLWKDIFDQRKLIYKLSINDFKTKYAGSYFGLIWSLIQPIMTVFMYWFVFQVGFKSAPVDGYPFILWLICGLVPWFYFSDALNGGTSAFTEYNFLVKKVKFRISILPVVKVISSTYVHLFFICFLLIFFIAYGYMPNIYFIQIIYYSFCTFILALSISLITSSLLVFLKDITQILSILLQFGMWFTPVVWNIEILSENIKWLFRINPTYYIIEGYRDSTLNCIWFYEKTRDTICFWAITLTLFVVGTFLFKKLKPHFADIL